MAKQLADIGTKLVWALVVLLLTVLLSVTLYKAEAANTLATSIDKEVSMVKIQASADKERLERIELDVRFIKEQLIKQSTDKGE